MFTVKPTVSPIGEAWLQGSRKCFNYLTANEERHYITAEQQQVDSCTESKQNIKLSVTHLWDTHQSSIHRHTEMNSINDFHL